MENVNQELLELARKAEQREKSKERAGYAALLFLFMPFILIGLLIILVTL